MHNLPKWLKNLQNKIETNWVFSLAAYVLFFGLTFLSATSALWMRGKGFIWIDDGLEQQYIFFLLEGDWIRQFAHNLVVNHVSEVPMWSNQIGYGSDYFISVMNTLGNPLNLISAFATRENADLLLNATVPITLCLSGITFLMYCKYKHLNYCYSIIGAIVYNFSAYSLLIFTQIYMLYPLVLAPLVLLGIEKIFDEKKPATYILSMFAVTLAGVYQAYTFCIMVAIYCVIRYVLINDKKNCRIFLSYFLLFAISTALAIGMGAVFFLPVADSILSQSRLGLERNDSFIYSLNYYLNLLAGTITAQSVGSECFYGFAPTALVAILALFGKNKTKQERLARTLFVIFFVMLSIPLIGKIMNGFSYPSNRWVWAVSLLAGICVPLSYPKLCGNSNNAKQVGINLVVFACVLLMALLPMLTNYGLFYEALSVSLVISLAMLALNQNKCKVLLGLTTLISVTFIYYQWGTGVSSSHVDLGESYETISENEPGVETLLSYVTDREEWRYEHETPGRRNSNVAFETLGVSFYNSLYNSNVDNLNTSVGLISSPFNFSFNGLEGESCLEALTGTKYYICKRTSIDTKPFLYSDYITSANVDDVQYDLWASDTMLPLAFIPSKSTTEQQYLEMNMAERQLALLSTSVLEKPINQTSNSDIKQTIQTASFTIESTDNCVTYEDETLTVLEPNASMTIGADIPTDSEAYLLLNNFIYESTLAGAASSESLGIKNNIDSFIRGISPTENRSATMQITSSAEDHTLWFPTSSHDLYGGKSSWAIPISSQAEGHSTITIRFSNPGIYHLDSIKIQAIPHSAITSALENLSKNVPTNQQLDSNRYSCNVEVSETSDMIIRIPYGKGWSAKIDGEQSTIANGDIGFMSIQIPKGTHVIELNYCTPGIKLGAIVSGVSWLLFAAYLLFASKAKLRLKVEGCYS